MLLVISVNFNFVIRKHCNGLEFHAQYRLHEIEEQKNTEKSWLCLPNYMDDGISNDEIARNEADSLVILIAAEVIFDLH